MNYEDCPIYQSEDDNLCGANLYEGELCNLRCRYLRETINELLEKGRTRLALIEGYEFPRQQTTADMELENPEIETL